MEMPRAVGDGDEQVLTTGQLKILCQSRFQGPLAYAVGGNGSSTAEMAAWSCRYPKHELNVAKVNFRRVKFSTSDGTAWILGLGIVLVSQTPQQAIL
jgi:hypothetical protein